MKTITHNQHLKEECENTGSYSFSLADLRPSSELDRFSQRRVLTPKQNAKKILKNLKSAKLLSALTDQVAAIGIKTNVRIILGLGLVLCLAPIADTFYTFLDRNDRVAQEVWYYEAYFYLFLCLGPYIKIVVITIGLYFIFVPNETKKIYLLIAPLAPTIGKIIWLCQVSNNEEYHRVLPWMYMVYGVFAVLAVLLIINYLTWRHHHRARAHKSRMDGLCQIANENDPIQKGFVTTWRQLSNQTY
jgi:hypothetical protein